MKLHDLLESRAAPLYHWLDLSKTEWMLEHDELLGKWDHYMPVEGKNLQGNSFSRNSRLDLNHSNVRITVDQQKLAATHRIIPVDGSYTFHGKGVHQMENPTDRAARLKHLDHLRDRTFLSDKSNYAEEFVVGDIKQAHKYITEVTAYFKTSSQSKRSGPWFTLQNELTAYCGEHNIKLVRK